MGHPRLIYHACAFALLAGLATPALGEERFVAVFPGAGSDEVSGEIGAECLLRDWYVAENESSQVKCNRPGVPLEVVRWQGRRGSRWAVVVDFTLVERGDETLVQVSEYITETDTLGRTTRHSRYDPESHYVEARKLIEQIGGQIR